MRNMNKLTVNPEEEATISLIAPASELGQAAVLLGLVAGQPYDGDSSVDQLPVKDNTFSAYGKTYDTGMGSEG